ncbi:MAG: type II toxin-antitoxin system VapC family toxin [Desulfovermiculus sp.]|nr:type II toxin-antitoxin system VapC family toxin [Desulfovermiculus sp.]
MMLPRSFYKRIGIVSIDLSVVYWDTSAVLSVLCKDSHSPRALNWTQVEGIHLMSTLAWAESCAVIARMHKEGILSKQTKEYIFEALRQGVWRRMNGLPDWDTTQRLGQKWSLHGADLWHLATAKSLHQELPELILLTFDEKLQVAAKEEGMGPGKDL